MACGRHARTLVGPPDPVHPVLQWLLDPGFDLVGAFDAHLRMIGARMDPDVPLGTAAGPPGADDGGYR